MAWCKTEGTQAIDIVWFFIKEVPNCCLVSRFSTKDAMQIRHVFIFAQYES